METKLTNNEMFVVNYLSGKDYFVSPTEIGNASMDMPTCKSYRHSSWASPICKKLVAKGILERNAIGWYRLVK